ncbi:MAG: fused MFS/spermidine synthase [Anaerolineae bacterium]|nr:fused MFS/spermidine synthase [Anaerolineae bacterium]
METELPQTRAPRLWAPTLIVFISSACIMVLELVAGRMVAPYVGVSLYTWTSIIGVILAGISLGNYLGGKLADRWASTRLLSLLFLLAGLTSIGVLFVDALGAAIPNEWPMVLRIIGLVAAVFFIPAVILGTISPVVTKLALRDLANTGSTVGRISAAGTVGSIVGTFATGFLLISWFGTHAIVWGVAVILLLMALGFFLAGTATRGRAVAAVLGLALIGGATAVAVWQGWTESRCSLETNYFCINVREDERDGSPVRILILDRLVHSYNDLNDPTKLVYGYEKVYAEATRYQSEQNPEMSALFIGGGGYTFPRYMEATYPGSALDVIEIDPGVTETAYQLLGLNRDTDIRSFNEDARMFLEREPDRAYRLIMGDAFNDYSVPYHLTTREFNERVKDWLADDGLYMVNLIDGPRRDFLRAYVHTLRGTFEHVYVVPAIRTWRESPRVTFVILATQQPLDLAQFAAIDGGDGETTIAQSLLSPDALDAIMAEGRLVMLTDRYAPVDQMLAPVARGEQVRPDAPEPARDNSKAE